MALTSKPAFSCSKDWRKMVLITPLLPAEPIMLIHLLISAPFTKILLVFIGRLADVDLLITEGCRSPQSPCSVPASGFPFLRRAVLRLRGIIKGGQIARFFPWRRSGRFGYLLRLLRTGILKCRKTQLPDRVFFNMNTGNVRLCGENPVKRRRVRFLAAGQSRGTAASSVLRAAGFLHCDIEDKRAATARNRLLPGYCVVPQVFRRLSALQAPPGSGLV